MVPVKLTLVAGYDRILGILTRGQPVLDPRSDCEQGPYRISILVMTKSLRTPKKKWHLSEPIFSMQTLTCAVSVDLATV